MEFEYADPDIHEDLYHIIKYSCGEVCTSTDQLDKVLRIWTTFLEPMFGVLPRPQGAEDAVDVVRTKNRAVKSNLASSRENNGCPGAVVTGNNKPVNPIMNGDDVSLPEQGSLYKARLANGDTPVNRNGFHDADRSAGRSDNPCSTPLHVKVQSTPIADEISGVTIQTAAAEQLADNNSLASRGEQAHGRANHENTSGSYLLWAI